MEEISYSTNWQGSDNSDAIAKGRFTSLLSCLQLLDQDKFRAKGGTLGQETADD